MLGVSEQRVTPADVVERPGLRQAQAGGTGQSQGLLRVGEFLLGTALLFEHRAKGDVAVGLADLVAELLEQAQGVPDVSVGLVVAAEPGAGTAETEVGMRLPVTVSATPCGGQRGELAGGPIVPAPPPLEDSPSVQESCQLSVVCSLSAANWMAASSTGYSASNQAQTCS